MIMAQKFAEMDQYRATTHNKGIMNGVDAVALAMGQDWRAVESAAHSYCSIGGQYKPLTKYWIEGSKFCGSLEMPISVGTKGGAIQSSPIYSNTMKILGYPTSSELACIMVSVGLSQNFAAIRALSVEGIQKGHMNLHARNVAIQAGIEPELIDQTVNFMKQRNQINIKYALAYQQGHQLYQSHIRQNPKMKKDLNSFYVELKLDFLPEPLNFSILFDCHTSLNYHLTIPGST
jgi:hydroxymethylglutaryl-CoA synthase